MKQTRYCLLITIVMQFVTNVTAQLTPTYDDIQIPMRDGEFLEADVFVPSGCTSCEAILVQTPYNKDVFSSGLPLGIGTNLDGQPYVWIIADWRGFYGSIPAAVANPDRGNDGYDVCEWIVAQSWHGSKIGTWGPSALGNIQYQLISKQHPNHTCAVPMVADGQTAYDSYFYGGVLEKSRLEQLDALGYGLSTTVLANPYYSNAWAYTESTTDYSDDIIIPTLQIGGWYDHNIDRMMSFYKRSRTTAAVNVRDEQWLLVGPWVHGGTGIAYVGSAAQGELNYPNAASVNNTMARDFFDYYLLNTANNWQNTPLVTYYEMGGNDTWHTSSADDIAATSSDVLYLKTGGVLDPINNGGTTMFPSDPMSPSPTIGGPTLHPALDQGPYDQSQLDGRSDVISFASPALTVSVPVTGRITLQLYVAADQADCDIAIRLADVYPDGRDMLITDGIRRMRFRTGYTQADEAFMAAGQVYPVTISLPFTNYTWLPGHKIKVYVSGNSSTRWDVNLQNGGPMYTAGAANTAAITIHHNSAYQSRINLPMQTPVLSMEEAVSDNVFMVPNPASGQVLVAGSEGWESYEVRDIMGRIVASGNLDLQSAFSVLGLSTGSYHVLLGKENGVMKELPLMVGH